MVLKGQAVWIGLAIMVVSEAATLVKIEPFWSWNTPIAWTGFIIFADAIVFRARGHSWMRSAPLELALLALASIPLWLVFEGYNRVLRNWYYVGLPENAALRTFGYAWSFATIWPAIFEGADLISVVRASRRSSGLVGLVESRSSAVSLPHLPSLRELRDLPDPRDRCGLLSAAIGAAMLIAPFLVSAAMARYLAAPVWLGFIFLLDPINAWRGGESLWDDSRATRRDRLTNLSRGVLWEFWNYWSRAKWHYSVPIMEHLKLFEMPLPGYFGFPAFAIECFTMYVFLRRAFTRAGRTIAL